MRWIRVTVVAVGVAALAWIPSGSNAQPDHAARGPATTTTAPARGDRTYRGYPIGAAAERLPRWDFGPVPQEDIDRALAFLKENSPRRYDVVTSMLGGAGPRSPLRRQLYVRYREMKVLEEEDPTLYKIKLEQIQVEDEMFGTAALMRDGARDGAMPSEELQGRMHKAARRFVNLRIEERKHLIAKLQAALAADQRDPEAAARQRIMREMYGERGAMRGEGDLPGEGGKAE